MSTTPIAPTISESPYLEIAGPILLLAGPGTGKTYQLARRIQSLVDTHGVGPDEITVITFTREAAKGMRSKLNTRGKAEYVEPGKQPKRILTMHSLGHGIIEENATAIGLKPGVQVVSDPVLKRALMRDAALIAGLSESESEIALKDKETANSSASSDSVKVQAEYAKLLRACNAVDYDDQIALACNILSNNQPVLDAYKARTKHLLVDEYQDINEDQHRLISLLTEGQREGLFAGGDDDQSIYGFRGGDPKFIRRFATDYPGAKVLQLQVSRRCLKNILDCAIALVVKYDSERSPKAPPTYELTEPGLVKIWNCPSEGREGKLIGKAIYSKTASGEAENFFVLVPSRNYLKPIAQGLTAAGVDHEIGASGDASEEWSNLVTLRNWLQQPTNLLTRHAIELVLCAGTTKMPGRRVKIEAKKAARHEYCQDVAGLWSPVLSAGQTLLESLADGAKTSTRLGEIDKLVEGIRTSHAADDLPAFLNSVRQAVKVFDSIDDFYRCLNALEAKPTSGGTKAAVRILTLQGSKGLEADCVFIVGLEDNSIPRDATDAAATAEEARLLFVAMTRAKKELHLLHARTRTGAATFRPNSRQLGPSVFIQSLPTGQASTQYVAAEGARKKTRA
jgi:ATP-dependent DNA helicase Rep